MPITRWLGADRYSTRSTTDPVSLDFFTSADLQGANETNLALIYASFSASAPVAYNNAGRYSLLDPTVLNDLEVQGELKHTGTTTGFFGAATVSQPSDIGAASTVTDSTGGTADTTLVAISGTSADGDLNDNFADLASAFNSLVSKVNALRAQQQSLGLMA